MRIHGIEPQFVEFIPRQLAEGILYISEKYKTASHLCACGCGEKVVTPLSPADWQLRKEGSAVSLYPSIGNWSYTCRSHYWIQRNHISWEGAMTQRQIAEVQARDRADKARYIAQVNNLKDETSRRAPSSTSKSQKKLHWSMKLWNAIKSWWTRS